MDNLIFYDDKPCADCKHLGIAHNEYGECSLCSCDAYHWHIGCEEELTARKE